MCNKQDYLALSLSFEVYRSAHYRVDRDNSGQDRVPMG